MSRKNRNKRDVKQEQATVVEEQVEQQEQMVEQEPVVEEAPAQEVTAEQEEVVVTEEPTKEEIKEEVVEPKKVEPKKIKTFEDLYEVEKDNPTTASVINAVKHYIDVVYKQNAVSEQTIASMNFELYNTMVNILKEDNFKRFKDKFNIINKLFLLEKDRYFNTISLSRYDHFWTFGGDSRMAYHMMVEAFSTLANPNTRREASKTMRLEKMDQYLPDGAIGKLKRYYNL